MDKMHRSSQPKNDTRSQPSSHDYSPSWDTPEFPSTQPSNLALPSPQYATTSPYVQYSQPLTPASESQPQSLQRAFHNSPSPSASDSMYAQMHGAPPVRNEPARDRYLPSAKKSHGSTNSPQGQDVSAHSPHHGQAESGQGPEADSPPAA
jgi:hypothetical protein